MDVWKSTEAFSNGLSELETFLSVKETLTKVGFTDGVQVIVKFSTSVSSGVR